MTVRILVIGAGSIGSRHARLLAELGADVRVWDPDVQRAQATGLPLHPAGLEHMDGFAGVVLASPTHLHAQQAEQTLRFSPDVRVLVEKPLATQPRLARELADLGRDRLAVAFNLRFHEPVRRLMALHAQGAIGALTAARFWFGYHLPDWRPGVDYRTTYSASRALGGGVLLDAVHEFDLAVALLGEGLEVRGAVADRLGRLELGVEDTARVLLRRGDGVVAEIALDYLSRQYRRGIELVGVDGTLRLDWARQVVEFDHAGGVRQEPAQVPVAASYARQAEAFVRWVSGGEQMPVSGTVGAESVRLVAETKQAAGLPPD